MILELVITQSKEIGKEKSRTSDAMALIEEAGNSRSVMARDDYDARRWKDEVADSREQIASSQSVVLSAVNETPGDTPNSNQAASTNGSTTNHATSPIMLPVGDVKSNATRDREVKPADSTVAKNDKPVFIPSAPPAVKEEPKPTADTPKTEPAKDNSPIDVGSLVAYATKQPSPIYPQAAKSLRTTGVVKVEVTINEAGDVAEVQKTSGPPMLQAAAKDAIRKWKFKPFVRDGQPVRATGFVSFNFAL